MPAPGDINSLFASLANIINSMLGSGSSSVPGAGTGTGTGTKTTV
ncbi:hypothetical protein [Rhodococcus spelaei]|nr:hypothetical protein [Rhodococcus spelaei]